MRLIATQNFSGINVEFFEDEDTIVYAHEEMTGLYIILGTTLNECIEYTKEMIGDNVNEWSNRILEYADNHKMKNMPMYESWLRGRQKAHMIFLSEEEDKPENNPWLEDARVKFEESEKNPELQQAFKEAGIDESQALLGLTGQHPETIEKIQKVWREHKQKKGAEEWHKKKEELDKEEQAYKDALANPSGTDVTITLTMDEKLKDFVMKTLEKVIKHYENKVTVT